MIWVPIITEAFSLVFFKVTPVPIKISPLMEFIFTYSSYFESEQAPITQSGEVEIALAENFSILLLTQNVLLTKMSGNDMAGMQSKTSKMKILELIV